jgi:hypothetical protein
MKNILLLEDLPEIRAWLRDLVLRSSPMPRSPRPRGCTTPCSWCRP